MNRRSLSFRPKVKAIFKNGGSLGEDDELPFVLLFSPICPLLLIIIYHPSHRVSLWSWRNWPGRWIRMVEKSIWMLGWFVSLIWISHSNVILAHSNEFYFSCVFPLWISWLFECNSDAFKWILFFFFVHFSHRFEWLLHYLRSHIRMVCA